MPSDDNDINALDESTLRQEYDDEEIARFLDLFRLYVTEVRLPGSPTVDQIISDSVKDELQQDSDQPTDSDWIAVHQTPLQTTSASSSALPEGLRSADSPQQSHPSYISEDIALNYLVPLLPSAGLPPKPPFSFGRLRLTLQRFYLALVRPYWHILKHTRDLATWKDKRTSMTFCISFWILWFYDLILPVAVALVLYALVRRRIFPYPSLKELKEHRAQIAAADQFSAEISSRLTTSSTWGVREMWRLFRLVTRTPKARAKGSVSPKGKGIAIPEDDEGPPLSPIQLDPQEPPSSEELDFKRDALYLLNQIIDFHERVINIFIWRRPRSSRIYGGILFMLFIITLVLPAHYVAKLLYGTLGFLFWHVTPVIAALPPSDRARLPPPFVDVPTHAEYAMQLISQRVAEGKEVVPPKKRKGRSRANTDDGNVSILDQGNQSKSSGVDWKKINDKVALGKAWAEDGKRLLSGKKWQESGSWPPRAPLVPPAVAYAQPGTASDVHSFPVTHSSSPGLLTLTSTTLMFTQLSKWSPKFTIPLNDVRAVKKTGMLKGLSILWWDRNNQEEKEEKFKWVGNRDELFARLVGASEGRRWLKA